MRGIEKVGHQPNCDPMSPKLYLFWWSPGLQWFVSSGVTDVRVLRENARVPGEKTLIADRNVLSDPETSCSKATENK